MVTSFLVNKKEYIKPMEKLHHETPFLSYFQLYRIAFQHLVLSIFYDPNWYRIGKYFSGIYNRLRISFFLPGSNRVDKPRSFPFPARLSNFQCKIGLQQLEYIEENIAHRQKLSKAYAKLLRPYFRIPRIKENSHVTFLRFPALVNNRDKFKWFLSDFARIESWFDPIFLGFVGDVRELEYEPGSCPVAEQVANHVVNFPTHPKIDGYFFILLKAKLARERDIREFVTVESR